MLYRLYDNNILKVSADRLEILRCENVWHTIEVANTSFVSTMRNIVVFNINSVLNIFDINERKTLCKIEGIDITSLSKVAISECQSFLALGYKSGLISIYSLIGARNVLQLSIFKNEAIDNIAFASGGLIFVVSRLNIKAVSL